jgi:hypothetical protein
MLARSICSRLVGWRFFVLIHARFVHPHPNEQKAAKK